MYTQNTYTGNNFKRKEHKGTAYFIQKSLSADQGCPAAPVMFKSYVGTRVSDYCYQPGPNQDSVTSTEKFLMEKAQ